MDFELPTLFRCIHALSSGSQGRTGTVQTRPSKQSPSGFRAILAALAYPAPMAGHDLIAHALSSAACPDVPKVAYAG